MGPPIMLNQRGLTPLIQKGSDPFDSGMTALSFANSRGILGTLKQLVRSCLLLAGAAVSAAPLGAQTWDDNATLGLVRRAIVRRSAQISDTALAGYQSRATGRLLFLAQLGDTSFMTPRVVKADQIAVDVFWKAPASSKQLIVGMRDTLLLPGDIGYYQDRYGIVQSNFPNLIRLGEGRDVRDVPHPLAPNAETIYEFALRDSLTITLPDRRIDVYEVAVRPREPRAARVVGSLFLDQGSADIVRMSLTFTDAAILDRRIERLSVVLENALIEGRFWLPRRQELEVARAGTWLDMPVRGIIRGSWQICCYQINLPIEAAVFTGPPISRAPFARRQGFQWNEPLSGVLPSDIATVTEEDVAKVQAVAQGLVSRSMLARARGSALSARSISDFVRFNRVEGLALGIGYRRQWAGSWTAALRARYGQDDEQIKGRAALGVTLHNLELVAFGERDYLDAGDFSEGSSLKNSLAAQEFGSDYTDPYEVRRTGLRLSTGTLGIRWDLQTAFVRHLALPVHASSAHGRFEPTIPAWELEGPELELRASRALSLGGGDLRMQGTLRAADLEAGVSDAAISDTRFVRGTALVRYTRERAHQVLRLSAFAAAAGSSDELPPQALVYIGGPVSGPGYPYHGLRAERGAALHAEYGFHVPFPSLPLARYGRSPGSARLLPYVHAIGIAQPARTSVASSGFYPSLGIALEFFFDLIRVETARGLRGDAVRWTFSSDLGEAFRSVF